MVMSDDDEDDLEASAFVARAECVGKIAGVAEVDDDRACPVRPKIMRVVARTSVRDGRPVSFSSTLGKAESSSG